MFNNLIESSSHVREFRRRGSFLLFTVIAYSLLFVIAGIASVYAYDAHLEGETAELTLLSFAPPPVNEIPQAKPGRSAASNGSPRNTLPTRPVAYESSSNPHSVPDKISTTASGIEPAPPRTVIAPFSSEGAGAFVAGNGKGDRSGGAGGSVVEIHETPPPPAAPKPTPPPILRVTSILNGKATFLPKPIYTSIARSTRASGLVTVQVLIDETGKVVSAHALNGHPLLTPEAVKAAYQARFSPTLLNQVPVKVSGVITYNFLLQ